MTADEFLQLKAKLLELYNSNENAKCMLDHWATVEKSYVTNSAAWLFVKFREVDKPPKRAIAKMLAVLRELERIGYGRNVSTNRNTVKHFQWFFPLHAIGKLATGKISVLKALQETEFTPGREDDDDPWEVVYPLRFNPSFNIHMKLPKNVSERELERLADFIKNLR